MSRTGTAAQIAPWSHVERAPLPIQAPLMGSKCWLGLAMLIPAPVIGGTLAVNIAGLAPEMESSVRASLTLSHYLDRDITRQQLDRELPDADDEIRTALEPFGYYAATVTRHLETNGDRFEVDFRVTPGAPVRVTQMRIEVSSEAAQVPLVAKALQAFAPRLEARLDHAEYERSKDAISAALTNAGYLSARLRDHRVEVRRAASSATIHLSWDCGMRYRFGPVRFPTTPLSQALLARRVPWKEGDYFSGEKLLELQSRLSDGDYFSIVSVRPRIENAEADRVPIEAELIAAKRDIYSGGLYASTDTGAGVKAAFQRRWLNSLGHKLQVDAEYAQRLQSYSLGYRIPFAGADDRALSFGLTYHDEETDSTEERTTKLAWRDTRKWRGFTRTLGVQLIGGDFEIGSEHGNSDELFAEASLARSRADEPAFPLQGYSFATSLKVAPASVISRTRFAALDVRGKWITPAGPRGRVILRAALGAMTADDFDELPPELRFFAGGDRSIRGFGYEAIGNRNDAGDIIGGKFLIVLSAEYERYFAKKWGVAAFVDGGDAFLRDDFDWNIGAGLGVRWKSPVGVVRLDVGMPIKTTLEKSVQVHVTIGPDL
jgi:translocation and assembly module TamA